MFHDSLKIDILISICKKLSVSTFINSVLVVQRFNDFGWGLFGSYDFNLARSVEKSVHLARSRKTMLILQDDVFLARSCTILQDDVNLARSCKNDVSLTRTCKTLLILQDFARRC